jgi:DNA-binding transcriptional ArsR family regulator
MQDVEVIESAEAAAAALDPVRARLLGELAVPCSAAGLASRVGLARQKVNYHLKALEAHGLVELAEERRHGGITERVLRATAASYVVSPAAVTASAADPDANDDHLSAATSSRWPVGWCARSAPSPAGPARPASACRP